MSNREHSPPPAEEYNVAEVAKQEPFAVSFTTRRSSRKPARRLRNAWFLLVVLLLGVVTIFALSNGGIRPSPQANRAQPGTSPATAMKTQSTTTLAIMATGDFREYPLPQSDSQMMRPAIDHEGRLWLGEMGRNFLAVFDPQTQTIQ